METASWNLQVGAVGGFFLDKTAWDTQNSIQIGLGKGEKSFPKQELWECCFSLSVNGTQCSFSEGFNNPGFQLETYSQLDLGMDLPLFPHARNLGGWIR